MKMARSPVSLTLDEANLQWLRRRARLVAEGNLSEAVDQLVTLARTGALGGAAPARSVVGTLDLAIDDPGLERADEAVVALFAAALARPAGRAEVRTRGRRG
jgi:hypothetical protein